jgi:hypothetical protein
MCNLSTAQEKFIKAAMKKNEEISDANHFKANGSWNKLKKLGKPNVSVGEINDLINYERLNRRFDFSNLTSEDKQHIINSYEYAVAKGSLFDEIAIIAFGIACDSNYFEDSITEMASNMILGFAKVQQAIICSRTDPKKRKSLEEPLLRKMKKIFKVFKE